MCCRCMMARDAMRRFMNLVVLTERMTTAAAAVVMDRKSLEGMGIMDESDDKEFRYALSPLLLLLSSSLLLCDKIQNEGDDGRRDLREDGACDKMS